MSFSKGPWELKKTIFCYLQPKNLIYFDQIETKLTSEMEEEKPFLKYSMVSFNVDDVSFSRSSQSELMLSRSFFIPSYNRFSLDSRLVSAWYPFVKHSIILSQTSQQAMLYRRCTCRLYIWNDRNEKQGWKIHGLGQENRQALALITPVWICVINLQVVNSTQTNFADIIA